MLKSQCIQYYVRPPSLSSFDMPGGRKPQRTKRRRRRRRGERRRSFHSLSSPFERRRSSVPSLLECERSEREREREREAMDVFSAALSLFASFCVQVARKETGPDICRRVDDAKTRFPSLALCNLRVQLRPTLSCSHVVKMHSK